MKTSTRNFAVGLTVLVALAALAGLIILFAGVPEWFQTGYRVLIHAEKTHDLNPGDPVYLQGMRVGNLTEVRFAEPGRPTAGITLVAVIDEGVKVPASVQAFIYTKGVVGSPYLQLQPTDIKRFHPETGEPLSYLPKDAPVTVEAIHKGSSMIPPELQNALKSVGDIGEAFAGLQDALGSFGRLAENLNRLIGPPPEAGPGAPDQLPGTQPATTQAVAETQPTRPAGLQGTLAKLDSALTAVNDVLGDRENQQNLKTSLANLATATEKATTAMESLQGFATKAEKITGDAKETFRDIRETVKGAGGQVEQLSEKLITDAEKISELIATVNRLMMKIEQGKGTAGQLLNDDKLYNDLVKTMQQMNSLVKDLRNLVTQWRKEGMKVQI